MGSRTQVALFSAALIMVCPSRAIAQQAPAPPSSSGGAGAGSSDDTLRMILTEQGPFSERLRLQIGYTTEGRPAPQERISDLFFTAIPEVTYFWGKTGAAMSLTYAMTGAVHSLGGATELANRLVFNAAFDLSRRTTMIVTGNLSHSSVQNFLTTSAAAGNTQPGLLLGGNARFVTAGVTQGLAYELTPSVRVSQNASVIGSTTIDPAPPVDSAFGSFGVGADKAWNRDAIGAFGIVSYGVTKFVPPQIDQQFYSLAAGPSWRHDWSRDVTSSVAAGIAVAGSPDLNTKPVLGEYASATVSYTFTDVTSAALTYTAGFTPAFLTNQLTRSHTGRISVSTPISLQHQVFATGGTGVSRASLLNLANPSNTQDFTMGVADIDVTWAFVEFMQFFARYQYIVQIGDSNNTAPPPVIGGATGQLNAGLTPSFMRDTIFIGVQFATRVPGTVQARFAERVDGSDGRNANGRPPDAGFSDRDEADRQQRERDRQRRDGSFEIVPGGANDPNRPRNNTQPQMFETDQTRWRYVTPAQEPRDESNQQPVIR